MFRLGSIIKMAAATTMTTSEESYLGSLTYQTIYANIFEKLKAASHQQHSDISALQHLASSIKQAEAASPSFLYELTKILLAKSQLDINLQVNFHRTQFQIRFGNISKSVIHKNFLISGLDP